ncbi:MAG TPA: hypothetical protein VFG59_11210 [Anaeromyxobacter sp.]|nr:hypothetical protein [Anaeromyxobacter sp.]
MREHEYPERRHETQAGTGEGPGRQLGERLPTDRLHLHGEERLRAGPLEVRQIPEVGALRCGMAAQEARQVSAQAADVVVLGGMRLEVAAAQGRKSVLVQGRRHGGEFGPQ